MHSETVKFEIICILKTVQGVFWNHTQNVFM